MEQTVGSSPESRIKIDTTLNTTQVDFQPLTASNTTPSFEIGSRVILEFSFFSPEASTFSIVVFSKHSNKEYSTEPSLFEYKQPGLIQSGVQLTMTLPKEIDSTTGTFTFRLKKNVVKVSQELFFDSPEFNVTFPAASFSWPTIVLLLLFPPALLLVAVLGAFVMCKRQRKVQQQEHEMEHSDYAPQMDDDVDINFEDDEEDTHHNNYSSSSRPNTKKRDDPPKMAFVLEDDDDEPMNGHVHDDDDDDRERRGNFYYTRKV